ncbi:MAG TPA: DNA polymerase III subunit alpha [Cryomorphaceae bacterium]|nr:DNA polymerase III subunit alpha [Cryomorphaceae bacterium]
MYLNCHSFYSFRYGTLRPEQLVNWAAEHRIPRLTLTDINSTAGCLEFIRLSNAKEVQPVVGVDFRNGIDPCFVALAKNNEGFREINAHLSLHLENAVAFPAEAPESFRNVYVVYPITNAPTRSLREYEYIGVRSSQLIKLQFSPWRNQLSKVVILQPSTFFQKKDYNAHRLLRAIDQNTLLSKLPDSEQTSHHDRFYSPAALEKAFGDFPQLIHNTNRILSECSIEFIFKDYQKSLNRKTFKLTLVEDRELIRHLCEEGLRYRYGENPGADKLERMENELEVIEARGFYSYFLINHDIIRYARHKGYFYVGRGSGANSMVAYLLRITDVDPIELDLYFERFMNPKRRHPPDFDMDFSWRDREDVTRYIFNRYPEAALLGSHTTFKSRAVVRELGKVMGLPAREIDQISHPRYRPQHPDSMAQLVLRYGSYIADFPNHMSVHSSGILIPHDDIHYCGGTFLPPKGDRTTQFDMYSAEDIGLSKFDILGQRGLGKIKDALSIIRHNQPEKELPDIHNVEPFFHDEKVKALLREGKTMACFYVESPAMRGLLTKLRADHYLGLVAASSIIRPGVAKSGMMQEYIKRFRQPETRNYIHPKLKEILEGTYGVMVYQEDVLKVAHHFAGLNLAEADILRRGMSWKFRERNEFWKVRDTFFSNCEKFGYDPDTTQEVWRQIESFGNFAFAKGHSASYAVESYQSLYLKAHYPLEYMVATINNGGGFYRTEVYINEARLHGAIIEPPCINHSSWETTLKGKHVFLGINLLHELETRVAESFLQNRERYGPFEDLQNFVDRVEISLEQLILLIRIHAFRFTGKDKKELLWEAHFLLGNARKSAPVSDLFRVKAPSYALPELEHEAHEDAYDEIELLGFPLSSPFDLIAGKPENIIMAHDLPHYVGKNVRMLGYLVHTKNLTTREKNSRHMQFGTFLDECGNFIDTIHFPQVAARYRFQGKGIYLLQGKVIEDYDFISLEVVHMEKLAYTSLQTA